MVAKTQASIEGLRRANQATAKLLQNLAKMALPGVTTRELDDYAMKYMTQLGAMPVFRTQEKFPGCINTSVNDAAVHGVPGKQKLQVGDVLSIDAGMSLHGYCGDSTITVAIGEVSPQHQRLIDMAHEAMMVGIRAAMPGKRIGDIGHAIESFAQARGFDVLRQYAGHGLGQRMHEDPVVPSVGWAGTGIVIPEGLVITIEPILVEKSPEVKVDADGWTVRTADGGWAAQFEHTVIVSRHGAKILSKL